MRVVADPSALWCATPEGAHVQTARGAWELRGESVARWLDRLVPLLDGDHEVAELTEGLDADRARVLTDLVEALVERGIAVRTTRSADEPIAHWLGGPGGPAPVGRPVRVVGLGPIAEELVAAAARAGVTGVAVGDTAPVAEGEVVLAAGHTYAARGHAFLVATADAVWIALPGPDGRPVRWDSIARRARALGAEQSPVDDPPRTATLVAAARLVRELVLAERGASAAPGPRVIRVDAASLAADEHRCPPVGARSTRRRAPPWSVPALTETEFSERVTRLCDDRLGVLGKLSEGGLRQLPLHATSVRVSDPVSGEPSTVLGHGPDLTAARVRAAAAGVLRYLAALPHPAFTEPCWGLDVADRRVVEVARHAAVGSGALAAAVGLSWWDAVLGALLQVTAALADPAAGGRSLPAAVLADDVVRLYLAQLSLLGVSPDLADLGEVAGAVTVTARCGNGVVTVSGTGAAAATRALLELLLVRTRVGLAGPPPVGPALLGEPVDEGAARAIAERIAARLRELGLRAVVLPFAGDHAVTDLVPFALRVVLADA